MKTLNIKNSWFSESDLRLNASYHLSDGRISKIEINNSPYKIEVLKDITSGIFNGARFKRYYVENPEKGIPFMGSSDMMKSDFYGIKYISKKLSKNIDSLRLKKEWILVSCSGTIGNTVFTNEDFINKTASQHIMRIVTNDKIKAGFLYSFLSSKYGYALLTQGTYGAVIQHIEPHHIENLPVPIFPESKQLEIHNIILDASKDRVEANKILDSIIKEIESKYNFKRNENIFSLNISDLKKGDKHTKENRFESDFYQPATSYIIEQIKNDLWAYIGDLSLEINRSGLRERKFVAEGIPLITGQNLNMARLQDLKKLSKKFTRNVEKNTTTESDILISVQGTIGKVEYVYQNMYEGVFASEQLSKIKIDKEKIHPGYVFAFLKSRIGQSQLVKHKTGSIIEWIRENNISSVIIPILPDKGHEIGIKINKYSQLQNKAYKNESEAIKMIEKEIESWQKS